MAKSEVTVLLIAGRPAKDDAVNELLACDGVRIAASDSVPHLLASGGGERPACLLIDLRDCDAGLPAAGDAALAIHRTEIPVLLLTRAAQRRSRTKGSDDDASPGLAGGRETVARTLEAARRTRGERSRREEIRRRMHTLTPREREVMECLVRGSNNRMIAAELGISPRTVEIHRARVMEKMEADSFSELVRMAFGVGVADGDEALDAP